MGLFTQNRKMRKSSKDSRYTIYNFTLPAIKTCPFADKCKKGCYATQGAFIWRNVKRKHESNLEASKKGSFIKVVIEELNKLQLKAVRQGKQLVIRIHDSGDFYSLEYLNKWIEVMLQTKHILFYAYTKSIPFFDKLELPLNFRVIYSYGGKYDHLIDVDTHKHTKVFENYTDMYSKGYISAMDNDIVAPKSKNNKIGLVYHSNLGFNNSGFSKIIL